MDAYLIACRSSLEHSLAEGLELLALPADTLNRRPAGGGWSAAECLAHLNATTEKYAPCIANAVDQARRRAWLAHKSFRPGWFERFFLGSIEPGNKRKFKAPAVFQPPPGLTISTIEQEWRATHSRMFELMNCSDELDLKRPKVTSPATRFLRLSLGASFALVATHDRRHILQAKHAIEK